MQHAQQFRLYRQRQFAHFIQKQSAAIGQFEFAAAVLGGPRKSASHMAEQLAFYQRVGQGGAIEADHRFIRAGRGRMNGLRHQLFTNAGFACDQYRQLTAAYQGYFFKQALVREALADQFFVR